MRGMAAAGCDGPRRRTGSGKRSGISTVCATCCTLGHGVSCFARNRRERNMTGLFQFGRHKSFLALGYRVEYDAMSENRTHRARL